jgi:dihydrofolate reductase/thymidylate synthase
MKYFKELTARTRDPTKQNAVIMGRKTWESIPAKFRPLPGRINVVLTRASAAAAAAGAAPIAGEGVHVSASLDSALALLSGGELGGRVESVFVIGGGQVYAESMASPLLSAVHLTRVEADAECDTFMQPVDEAAFRVWAASAPRRDAEGGPRYAFLCYTRAAAGGGDAAAPDAGAGGGGGGGAALPPGAPPHEEAQYLEMIDDVMRNGVLRGDRTGTGTYSKFGTTMRFNLRHSFPLLTTKRVFWRGGPRAGA